MVSFVILHYKNVFDTLECIASIKKFKGKYSIVVVDNGTLSMDDKEKILKETPDVICNEENLGFAKGNNIGCQYAIRHYHPDFLVVTNNDIIIEQKDFITRVQKCYQKIKFDFMGPQILTDGGESVNPFMAYRTLQEVEQAISKTKKLIRIYQSSILSCLLSFYFRIKYLFCHPEHLENGKESLEGVALHGCFLIFSKKYYETYDDIFYPETFLYHEEEFLEYRRRRDKLISYYDASILVFHKEGASLDFAFQNRDRQKKVFRNREILKSLQLLKNVMVKGEKI